MPVLPHFVFNDHVVALLSFESIVLVFLVFCQLFVGEIRAKRGRAEPVGGDCLMRLIFWVQVFAGHYAIDCNANGNGDQACCGLHGVLG